MCGGFEAGRQAALKASGMEQAGKIDRIREDFPFPEQVAEQAEEFKLE